jgi:hypothetical protein
MGGGGAAGAREFDVPIIDAAVVEELFGGGEDRDFGGNGDLAETRESEIGIAKGGEMIAVFGDVLSDLLRSFRFDGVDEKKRGVTGVVCADVLDGWSITIRNGAVGADEKKDDDFGAGATEGVNRFAIEVQCGGSRGLREAEAGGNAQTEHDERE